VFIAIEQRRADDLVRYADLYQHGLKQLTEKGAWYTKAAYPYLNTITCAGHSTLGTGTYPYKHGMVLNAWFNRETGKMMTCTEDPSVKEVSFTDTPGIADSANDSASADTTTRVDSVINSTAGHLDIPAGWPRRSMA